MTAGFIDRYRQAEIVIVPDGLGNKMATNLSTN